MPKRKLPQAAARQSEFPLILMHYFMRRVKACTALICPKQTLKMEQNKQPSELNALLFKLKEAPRIELNISAPDVFVLALHLQRSANYSTNKSEEGEAKLLAKALSRLLQDLVPEKKEIIEEIIATATKETFRLGAGVDRGTASFVAKVAILLKAFEDSASLVQYFSGEKSSVWINTWIQQAETELRLQTMEQRRQFVETKLTRLFEQFEHKDENADENSSSEFFFDYN